MSDRGPEVGCGHGGLLSVPNGYGMSGYGSTGERRRAGASLLPAGCRRMGDAVPDVVCERP